MYDMQNLTKFEKYASSRRPRSKRLPRSMSLPTSRRDSRQI